MRLVLIGGGGHASDVLAVIEALDLVAEVGVVADDDVDISRFRDRGVRQWGTITDLHVLDATHYVMAIGYSQARRAVQDRIEPLGLGAVTLVHPQACVHRSAVIGAGTVVFAGAVISPLARIGEHSVIHHNSVVGHDCRMGRFTTVLPGASLSGDTSFGEACLIGSGAVVIEKLSVGPAAVIGAGAVVTSDVPAGARAIGVPARWEQRKGG